MEDKYCIEWCNICNITKSTIPANPRCQTSWQWHQGIHHNIKHTNLNKIITLLLQVNCMVVHVLVLNIIGIQSDKNTNFKLNFWSIYWSIIYMHIHLVNNYTNLSAVNLFRIRLCTKFEEKKCSASLTRSSQ